MRVRKFTKGFKLYELIGNQDIKRFLGNLYKHNQLISMYSKVFHILFTSSYVILGDILNITFVEFSKMKVLISSIVVMKYKIF